MRNSVEANLNKRIILIIYEQHEELDRLNYLMVYLKLLQCCLLSGILMYIHQSFVICIQPFGLYKYFNQCTQRSILQQKRIRSVICHCFRVLLAHLQSIFITVQQVGREISIQEGHQVCRLNSILNLNCELSNQAPHLKYHSGKNHRLISILWC